MDNRPNLSNLPISALLRKFYNQFKCKQTVIPTVYNEIEKKIRAKLYHDIDADLMDDVIQQFALNVCTSFIKSDVWEKWNEDSVESDKVLFTYFERILNTSKNEILHNKLNRESINLYNNVRNICNDLLKNGIIKKDKDFYFNADIIPGKIFQGELASSFISIRNSNGTISGELLTHLILELFTEHLENYKISLSNIVKAVSEITDVGKINLLSINAPFSKNEEGEESYFELPNIEENVGAEVTAEINSNIGIWWDRLNFFYQNKKDLTVNSYIFYLKYREKLTLAEISTLLNNKIKKSTVDDRLKTMIKAMRINNELNADDPLIVKNIEMFCDFLNSRYLFNEHSKGAK